MTIRATVALGGALVLSVLAARVEAAPLTFGEIDGRKDMSASAELAGCRPDGDDTACRLARTSFGGLPIERSQVRLNAEGRVKSVEIALDDADHDTAARLLAGRYGPASEATEWRQFDDRALIAVARTASNSLITFRFPGNATMASTLALDTRLAVPVLLFLLLGLGVRLLFRRWRRAPTRQPVMREPTMRETLERRLAQGDDFRF